MFFPFSIKTSKCSGRTNETGHIEWHEKCKCECKFGASVSNNKQCLNKHKFRCECKELIDKGMCNKGFT